MPLFQIKYRFSGAVRFEGEFGSLRLCVEAGLRAGADLAGADLAVANLAGADLAGADLAVANLARANLAGANLAVANLVRANLAGANLAGADLAGADLAGAYLADANLAGADLADANLAGADLAGADLADANLAGADLADANLAGANLAVAKGLTIERASPLAMLRYQPGPIRLFKVLTSEGEGHINGGLHYPMGEAVEEPNASTDPAELCGAGLHVATLDWCLREWRDGLTISVVEFTAADIACIPLGTDGKLRLFRCKRVEDLPREDVLRMLGKEPA